MTSNQPTWAEIVSKVEHGVVQVITSSGSGSGFVVSDAGHVITNAHVVRDADNRVYYGDTVTVRFLGKVEVDGVILPPGIRDNVDLACLQVIGSPLRVPLSLRNFASVQVGEPVIAVGYPVPDKIDDALTVTQGIVSAKHHGPPQKLQTDADVNPGNSGGPLIDQQGNVIGVNTHVTLDGGKLVPGINFAIAANAVKQKFPFIDRATHPPTPPEPRTPAPAPPEPQPDGTPQHIIFGERFSINLRPPWELSPGSTPNFARFQSDVSSLSLYLVDTGDKLPTFASRNRESLQVRVTTWASGEVGKLTPGQHPGKQSFHFDYQGEHRDGDGVFKGRYNFSPLECGGQRYILFAGLVTWENSPDDKAELRLVLNTFLSRLKPA